jgi:ubiquinone/menaquinone biosynthesis C-methylase UbiE
MTNAVLSHEQARRFYDRFGARQDGQEFYERRAVEELLAQMELGSAHAVVELGCGTGRIAAELLRQWLPAEATYLGFDVSATMVGLARQRVAEFGARAEIRQTDGSPSIDAPDGAFDRFVSTYVLDLLSLDDVDAILAEAHRVLRPGGLLGLVGLTPGRRGLSKLVTLLWDGIHRLRPQLVGGCRPLELTPRLSSGKFRVHHHNVVTPWGLASELVVAERRGDVSRAAEG